MTEVCLVWYVSTENAILLGSKDHLTTGRQMEENHPYKKPLKNLLT